MANPKHVEKIKKALSSGNVTEWNQWRGSKYRIDHVYGYISEVEVDLSGANLSGLWSFSHLDLADVNFQNAKLQTANFHSANLRRSDLRGADLTRADLRRAILDGANMGGAHLQYSNLGAASLIEVNLSEAHLQNSNLYGTRFQQTNLKGADISGCRVYGVSVWDTNVENVNQNDLIITRTDQSTVTVDNIAVAQFVYLMLNNSHLRNILDTITSKVVLILGRFKDRKFILDSIREHLRIYNYVPILFDFEKPAALDFTETVTLLARMARFIIADLTEPSSIPQELQSIVPNLAIPVQPILQGNKPYAMFQDFKKYDWLLKVYRYEGLEPLIASLNEKVIVPAEQKRKDLVNRKMESNE